MKKIIIPCAIAIAAAIGLAVTMFMFKPGDASADKPDPPAEIPSGSYYIDGDPQNDELYLVVDGGNIRFANRDNDVREGFRSALERLGPAYYDNMETQLDVTMEDWGDTYAYKNKWFPGYSDFFMVMFRMTESEDGENYSGQGLKYYPETKTLNFVMGDFVLAE